MTEQLLAERTRLIGDALRAGTPEPVSTITWNHTDWLDAGAIHGAAMMPLPQVQAAGWGNVTKTLVTSDKKPFWAHTFHCCPRRIAENTIHLPGDSVTDHLSVAHYVELILLWVECNVDSPDDVWEAFFDRTDALIWVPSPHDLLFTIQNVGLDDTVGVRSDLSGDSRWAFEDLDMRSNPASPITKRDTSYE